MAKKIAVSITIDREILRDLDEVLRKTQERELRAKRPLSNRSSLIEHIVANYVRGESPDS